MIKKKNKINENKGDLAQKAYMGLRQMLFYNEIVPGQKIKYQDLALRLGVSITPVIQALKWLEFKGLVRHEPNKGYCVDEISHQEINEIYQTRLMLEVALVPDIMRNLEESGLSGVESAFQAFETAVKNKNPYERMLTDMKFHLTLASLSKCRVQLKILQEMFDLLLLKYSRSLFFVSIMETSLQEHRMILDALEKQDPAELESNMTHHIGSVRDHILKSLDYMGDYPKEQVTDYFSFL